MENCLFDNFKKIELKIGKIIKADKINNSNKLLKLIVDIGEKDDDGKGRYREIIAGIGKSYNLDELINSEIVIVSNLSPKKFSIQGEDFESNGMLLATSDENGVVLLQPKRSVLPGSLIK